MIAIVCALRCEAESLVRHFNLKAVTQKGLFPIYGDGKLFVIISGVGKISAAAAVAYLYAIAGEKSLTAWLNVGVGGHSSHAIGSGFFAHQVVDQGSGRTFYPVMTWKKRETTETLYTVDKVEATFSLNGIYEMEASGFCSSAFAVSSAELVHCYKVISDNLDTPPKKDPNFVKELIVNQISKIEQNVTQLAHLIEEMHTWHSVDTPIAPFLQKWHFTQTEMFLLQRVLQRWKALYPEGAIMDAQLLSCKNAKEVLKCLNQKMHSFR